MHTILVVDDLAIVREPIDAALRAAGYATRMAANGAEALASLSAEAPDLVLLDLGLPVVDGMTVLRTLRANKGWRGIPVVILSAAVERNLIAEAARLGISGYILKAEFSLDRLLTRIRAVLADPIAASPSDTPVPTPGPPVPAAARAGPAPYEGVPKATEALAGLDRILSRDEVLRLVGTKTELDGFSPAVVQVLKLARSPDCSVEALARAIGRDQAVALKMLKLANSAAYTRSAPVDSVHTAVVRIGLERIHQAVLNIAVVERFRAGAFESDLSTAQFWEHGIACGVIAAELAHAAGAPGAENAFTCGLLHDAGRVVLLQQLGERYVRVLETARRLQLPLEQIETRTIELNHADIMDRVLHGWSFPQDLIDPILHHHLSPRSARQRGLRQIDDVLRLGLANRLAHALMIGSSGNEAVYPTHEHAAALGLSPSVVANIEANARAQTDDIKFVMLANSAAAAWPVRADEWRRTLAGPFRPLFVGAHPELDAYRVFCEALRGPADEEPPNVAVIHIAGVDECAGVSAALTAAESAAGVPALPALVLSPGAKLAPEHHALAGRAFRALPSPVAIARFVSAVNEMLAPVAARAAA